MIVIGALRVKNEGRWIARALASIIPICTRVVVFDDHSTDQTRQICEWTAGVELLRSPFPDDGKPQEVRDKNYLLDYVRPSNPDWVVMTDGDEILTMPDQLLGMMQRTLPGVRALALPVLYMWDREDQIRVDGVYGTMSRVSVFRPGPERFEPTGPRGFHCGNAPQGIKGRTLVNAPLLHLGYMHRDDRLRKYAWYREQDPGNVVEGEYRHIVQGDVPEVPADAKLVHAGPLKLRPLR